MANITYRPPVLAPHYPPNAGPAQETTPQPAAEATTEHKHNPPRLTIETHTEADNAPPTIEHEDTPTMTIQPDTARFFPRGSSAS